MNKEELKYIELKTGYNDNGPAWIGYVTKSKSGQTIYFNNIAFQSQKGHYSAFWNSNYFDIESNDNYWISGVKKQGSDRKPGCSGKTYIQKRAIAEYCKIKGISKIPKGNFEVVELDMQEKEDLGKLIQ